MHQSVKSTIIDSDSGLLPVLRQALTLCDVTMGTMASQITSLAIVYYSIVHSGADRRKHHRSASLAFVRGIHRWPVNSPHKWPVTRKMFPFDDVIMIWAYDDFQPIVAFGTNFTGWPSKICYCQSSFIISASQWASWRLKSPTTCLFVQQFAWLNSKKSPKPVLLTLCEGIPPVTGEFPSRKGTVARKASQIAKFVWPTWVMLALWTLLSGEFMSWRYHEKEPVWHATINILNLLWMFGKSDSLQYILFCV